jgi:MoaA/NifB/PqqE/SkfB family radical SAM enzyme
MTTNGSLVPKRMEDLKRLNLLCFSIDGRRENNDRNRGAGTFDKAIAGLEMCKAAGIPVQLSAVLTRQTVHDIDFMVELAEKYSCAVGFATLINQRGTPQKEISDLYPSNEEVRKAMLRIAELKKQGKPILFSAESYEYAACWSDYKQDIFLGETPDFQPIHCYAGKYFCLVDYNGDVYPCPQLVGIWKPGNVMRDGLRASLDKAANHNCKACCVPCSNDFNLFFGLKLGVLLDHLQNYGRN